MIYIVEDDAGIRELIGYALSSVGFKTSQSVCADEFFSALDPARAELAVVDVMLPGKSGLEIVADLRARPETERIPVMLVSALSSEMDKVRGLDLGADDYLAKPFGVMELIARVRALLRRGQTGGSLSAGGVSVWPQSHRVTGPDGEVTLTLKEFGLLEYLFRNAGTIVRREELLGAVWGYSGGEETRTVDVHIRSLRKKLGRGGDVISTVRGVGYMVVG